MLQKLALAVKSKTIEFFAEDEDEEDDSESTISTGAGAEQVITGQRVVVLKPDPLPPPPEPETIATSIFATLASFRWTYLIVRSAQSPLVPEVLRSADSAAVNHLQRLSQIKQSYLQPSLKPHSLSSLLQQQVLENQSLLREFQSVVNSLQSEIDKLDSDAAALRSRAAELDQENFKLQRRLDMACSPPEEKVEAFLTVGVFNSVLKDAYRSTHGFTRLLVELMEKLGWDVAAAANSVYPGVNYAKPGHCRYAILSYVCLEMFGGFDREGFCSEEGCGESGDGKYCSAGDDRRSDSLRQFIEHSVVDPLELVSFSQGCNFSKFCNRKYQRLIQKASETSILGNFEEYISDFLVPSSPLYEHFVNMASSIWMLHMLALAYDPVVEIFQVGQGMEFNAVYMESVVRRLHLGCMIKTRWQVAFTVIPGFRIGRTVIQSKVYLDNLK